MFTEMNVLHAVQKTGRSFLVFVDHLGPLFSQDKFFLLGTMKHSNDIWILQECLAAESSVI